MAAYLSFGGDVEVDNFTSGGFGGGAGEYEALSLGAHGRTGETGTGDHRIGVLIITQEPDEHHFVDVNVMKSIDRKSVV